MTDVKRLLDEATPLPWVLPVASTDADAALILHAVNSLPDYAAAVDALERIRDHGYQPMYNGRPSCPFCAHFLDDEETHAVNCLTVVIPRRLRGEAPR